MLARRSWGAGMGCHTQGLEKPCRMLTLHLARYMPHGCTPYGYVRCAVCAFLRAEHVAWPRRALHAAWSCTVMCLACSYKLN